ncbi:MAG: hypothetical protein V1871_00325 [Planctomycetota bacterium]
MKRTIWLIIVLILSVCGCENFNNQSQAYRPQATASKNYVINAEMTSSVGREMVVLKITSGDAELSRYLMYSGRTGDTIQLNSKQDFSTGYSSDREKLACLLEIQTEMKVYDSNVDITPQELKYDIAKSDIIVCCNFRIKVLETNNEKIRFIVLADDNK